MALKLVIFDCDGVMFDSRDSNRAYYNALLERFGKPPMDEDEWAFVHTHNVEDSVRHIFRNHPDVDLDAVRNYRISLDYTPFLAHMRIEPDLKDFLAWLRPRCHTAISTNRTTTMPAIMEAHDLWPWFDRVVTAMDTPRPKPARDALDDILGYFGVGVDEAIFIGDSQVDRQHVDTVGMRLIAFRNPELRADFHVDSFTELRGLPPFAALRDREGTGA